MRAEEKDIRQSIEHWVLSKRVVYQIGAPLILDNGTHREDMSIVVLGVPIGYQQIIVKQSLAPWESRKHSTPLRLSAGCRQSSLDRCAQAHPSRPGTL